LYEEQGRAATEVQFRLGQKVFVKHLRKFGTIIDAHIDADRYLVSGDDWSRWIGGQHLEPAETLPTTAKPSFEEVGRSIGALVAEKNAAYGDAVNATAEYLRWLYPNGIPVDRYRDVGLLVRIGDKLKRIANGDNGEESAWSDICGYAILGVAGGGGDVPA
jgi:hypothetical protein